MGEDILEDMDMAVMVITLERDLPMLTATTEDILVDTDGGYGHYLGKRSADADSYYGGYLGGYGYGGYGHYLGKRSAEAKPYYGLGYGGYGYGGYGGYVYGK